VANNLLLLAALDILTPSKNCLLVIAISM